MFTSASLLTDDSVANETDNEKAARQHSAVNGDLIFPGAMGPSEPSMALQFYSIPIHLFNLPVNEEKTW
jgi:hypothetical protein